MANGYRQRFKHRDYRYVLGPWDSVLEDTSIGIPDPRFLGSATNTYRQKGGERVWLPRPGCFKFNSTQRSTSTQGEHQFTKLDGTEYAITVTAGQVYVLNFTTGQLDLALSTANITGAGATLSSSSSVRVYITTFNNKAIFSDGVNAPFAWDGTTAGGITPLTNCPALYGQPTVRSAKFVGIKASDPRTIVWSEELQENVGYESGAYTNRWTLAQTEQERLYAIIGTNDGFYYFRQYSIGLVLGEISADWTTTSTHDAVSLSIGTIYPASVFLWDRTIYFLDAERRFHRFAIGGEIQPLWQQHRTSLSTVVSQSFGQTFAITDLRLIVNARGISSSNVVRLFVYDADTGAFYGNWTMTLAYTTTGNIPHWYELKDNYGVKRLCAFFSGYVTMLFLTLDQQNGLSNFYGGGGSYTDADSTGFSVGYESAAFGEDDVESEKTFHMAAADVNGISVNSSTFSGTWSLKSSADLNGLGSTASGSWSQAFPVTSAGRQIVWGINHIARVLKSFSFTYTTTGSAALRLYRLRLKAVYAGSSPDTY